MSILQDYEKHRKLIGQKLIDAISVYIDHLGKMGISILYSDIIYKKTEWQKFEKWYKRVYNTKHGRCSKRN